MPDSKNIAKGQEHLSRMQMLDGKRPPLPAIDGYGYLVECLFEVGPVVSNGMGLESVRWQEIAAWAALCQCQLTPWEATTIKSMSAAYAHEAGEANNPAAPPPWIELPSEEQRTQIAKNVRGWLHS